MLAARMHQTFVRIASVILFVLQVVSNAQGFESAEHRLVSNLGACIAREILQPRVQCPIAPACPGDLRNGRLQRGWRILCDFLTQQIGRERNQVGYGEISKYADYAASPSLLLEGKGDGCNRVARRVVEERNDSFYAGSGEVIRNPHHFRELGLAEYHLWHEHAVLLARHAAEQTDPNYLYDALILNAYADHFLEDFFAPGHVLKDDEDRSHQEVLRIHDMGNLLGHRFCISDDVGDRLFKEPISGNPIFESPEDFEAVFKAGVCAEVGSAALWTAYQDLQNDLADGGTFLRGDDELYPLSRGRRSLHNEKQVVLLAFVVARSILDVVNAYDGASPFFENRRCSEDDLKFNSCPAGCYAIGPGARSNARFLAANEVGCYLATECPIPDRSDLEGRSTLKAREVRHEERGDPVGPPALVGSLPVVGLSAELQRLNEGSRKQFSGEAVFTLPPEWRKGSPQALRFVAIPNEVAAGYTYVRGNSYEGHGPDLHFYWQFKKLNAFYAFDLGYRFYDGMGVSDDLMTVGSRIGFGSGIPWVYAGISRDASIEEVTEPDADADDVIPQGVTDYSTFGLGATARLSPTLLMRGYRLLRGGKEHVGENEMDPVDSKKSAVDSPQEGQ